MKQYITKALLCLSVAMLVFNCQKEDDSLGPQNTAAPFSKPLNLSRLSTKAIKNDKNLMRIITKAETKRIEAKANKTVYNAQYDFTINTNYAKVITKSNGLKNYTFGVHRTEDNGLLENLLLETQNDGTFKVSLVQYNITADERSALANQEIVDVEDKITFTTLEDISDTIFDKVNSDAETCTVYSYEMYQGNSCASGNHEYTDGAACNYWGNPDQMATSGGYVLTANEEGCGDGGGSTGYTDGSPNGNPSGNQGGGYGSNGTSTIEDPATTPVLCTDCPEISENDCPEVNPDSLIEAEAVFGTGNVTFDCSLNSNNTLHFNSAQEANEFIESFSNMPAVDGEFIDNNEGDPKIDRRYFTISQGVANCRLKVTVLYEDPASQDECMNVISVVPQLIGNTTFHTWTSTFPTIVTDNGEVVTMVTEGIVKINVDADGLPLAVSITKSVTVTMKYDYSTSTYMGGDIIIVSQ